MPNWTTNKAVIVGPEEEIKSFYKKLEEWGSVNHSKFTDTGYNWIGNLVIGAGFVDEKGKPTLKSRGEICERSLGEDQRIYVLYTFAWDSGEDTWKSILEKVAPNCKFYYLTADISMGNVFTNDENMEVFPETILLNITIDHPEEDCIEDFYTVEDAKQELFDMYERLTGHEIEDDEDISLKDLAIKVSQLNLPTDDKYMRANPEITIYSIERLPY